MRILLLLGSLLCGVTTLAYAATDKIFCYYGSWATYRVSHGKFDVEDINPKLCTHVIYTFIGLDSTNNMVKVLDSWNDVSLQGFKRFVGLKSKNPSLKTMVAVGGWNEGSASYSNMVSSPVSRKAFIDSAVALMKTYGFDGLDIDWEYPTLRGGRPDDRVNFITLLSELRQRFNTEKLLLSIAVAASKDYHRSAYNVPEINKYVDFVNLMAYDLHAYWDAQTGHNAPLYAAPWETDSFTSLLNGDSCVRGWLDDGLDASKLIMGVPAYGHTFTLASTANTGVGVRTIGGGTAGPYTLESGTLSYLEICERMKTGYTKMWDNVQKSPYAFMGNQWISYDDVTSLTLKVNYAKSKNIGGVMVWSLESDDARNYCGEGAYPMGTAVYNAVFGSAPPVTTTTPPVTTTTTAATTTTTRAITTTTTQAPTTTTTAKPTTTTQGPKTTTTVKPTTTTQAATTTTTAKTTTTTPKPTITTTTPKPATTTTPQPGRIVCYNGFAADPTDCRYFYQCDAFNNIVPSWRLQCQNGLYFDVTRSYCNWSYLVSCNM